MIASTEPLLPLIVLTALFVLGVPVFALYVRKHGLPKDERIEKRKVGPFLGRWLMYYLLWLIAPIERLLIRMGISPNALTFSSLLLSSGAAVALAFGRFGLGGWLYLFTGIFDIFDGRVARATGRVTRGGAFYDSVVDRWAEALIFCGLAWYYRQSWVLFLVLIALVASFMVSYARARGEGLGATTGDAGAMQRPERILYLGAGIALSPVVAALDYDPRIGMMDGGAHPLHLLAVIALALVAVTSLATAVRRSWVIFRQLANRPLDDAPVAPAAEPPQPLTPLKQDSSSANDSPRSPTSPVDHDESEKRSAQPQTVDAESSLLV
jgi:phosphatidylglycerophosphate synthase